MTYVRTEDSRESLNTQKKHTHRQLRVRQEEDRDNNYEVCAQFSYPGPRDPVSAVGFSRGIT